MPAGGAGADVAAIADEGIDPKTLAEISELKGLLGKLGGKENAKRRQGINRKIRRLQERGARGGARGAAAAAAPPRPESPFKTKRGAGGGVIVSIVDDALVPHQYERHGRVGRGSFATCYKATALETGATVCLKVTDLCQKKIDTVDVRDEMNFLRRLRHPNCLSLFGFNVDIRLIVTMVVEFCPYSLEDIRVACDKNESVRTRIDATLARMCISQVIAGVRYMHNYADGEAIAHFDIKPDNIMSTSEGVLKIADFGLAVALKGKLGVVTDGMYRGTDEYMAPEVAAGKKSTYGLPADVWSIGVSFYELLFGHLCKPARPSFPRRLLEALSKAGLQDTVDVGDGDGSASLNELLMLHFGMCFRVDPHTRASIEALAADPLFQFDPAECATAVLAEIQVVERLKQARSRAKREYASRGALKDLDLESSSDSSDDSSDDSDDDADDDDTADDGDDDEASDDDDEASDDADEASDDADQVKDAAEANEDDADKVNDDADGGDD